MLSGLTAIQKEQNTLLNNLRTKKEIIMKIRKQELGRLLLLTSWSNGDDIYPPILRQLENWKIYMK